MVERSDLVKIGKYISILRKNKGYTQKALGELIDVNDKTISKWEQGSIAPDITILKSLAKVLDTSIDDLLSGGNQDLDIKGTTTIKKNNKSFLPIILSIVFGIVIALVAVVYIEQYYRVNYKEIKIRDEFAIDGFIISNKSQNYFVIKDILYQSDEIGTDIEGEINNLQIVIENDNKEIFNTTYLIDDTMSINKFFNNYVIVLNLDKNYKDNLTINILFYDNQNEVHGFHYQL